MQRTKYEMFFLWPNRLYSGANSLIIMIAKHEKKVTAFPAMGIEALNIPFHDYYYRHHD